MNEKIQQKLLSIAVIAIALIAVLAVAQPALAAEHNSVRLYGEDAFSAAFPYQTPEGPFDPLSPEAPVKDFMTFNPALIEDEPDIVVNNVDAKQKVFARQWFVPYYVEPTGDVWLDTYNPSTRDWEDTHNDYISEDVVTEYTYMFIDKHYQPFPAYPETTSFFFPVADNSDAQIGLDGYDVNGDGIADPVLLRNVDDFNGDDQKDILITTDQMAVGVDEEIQFLDHKAKIVDIVLGPDGDVDSVAVEIYYTGNDNPQRIESASAVYTVAKGDLLVAGRHDVDVDGPATFNTPWGMRIFSSNVNHDKVYLEVGRRLHTEETFFVDGAEYDVAAIYGPEENCVKYITIRNPVPEHNDVNLQDLSVIKESVDDCEIVPMLPPFNMEHSMIDDIKIPEYADHSTFCYYPGSSEYAYGIDKPYDTIGERIINGVAPLEIYFVDKDVEPRFDTDLYEILDEGDDLETWKLLNVHTMPDFYKEFVYPELPDVGPDNGDFLLTLSWRAPNSEVCDEPFCQDVVANPPRVMINYAQEIGAEDIYVNEYNDMTALRLYGQGGISAAFPYTDPEAPFDPLNPEAPEKDFVTLPPALIKAPIVVDNVDAWEKVFFRQWFVPELVEPVGDVWLDPANTYVSEDVVSEYTYLFFDKHGLPTEGFAEGVAAGPTWFWFPIADNDDAQIGLDSYDVDNDGVDDPVLLRRVADFEGDNTPGQKDVVISTDKIQVELNEVVQFLDHEVKIVDINYGLDGEIDNVAVEVYYTGNDEEQRIKTSSAVYTVNKGQALIAGRHDVQVGAAPTFNLPWYMLVSSSGVNNDAVYLEVGRKLHTGETFFADGAEYDVAMIFGSQEFSVKYITLRNPVPEHNDVNLQDLSVIKESVQDGEIIPVLPPFNKDHLMIDDIDLDIIPVNPYLTCYYPDGTSFADRTFEVGPTEIFFTGKHTEERFHTNLLEILCEGPRDSTPDQLGEEVWKWLHIRTMPDFYKEFVYPDMPNYGNGVHDYLVTSSFVAPNTQTCDDSIQKRVIFGHDPLDGTGLYMNQDDVCDPVEPPVESFWEIYDEDGNDSISKEEVMNAINDFFAPDSDMTKEQVMEVIDKFFE